MKKILLLLFLVPIVVFGQVTLERELKITGNVRDVSGMPLTGAALLVKGTSNATKTNFDGNFNLKVVEGEVLIISYSGFKNKEITVGNKNKINIILENEVKSETERALTKSDIRKKRHSENKARRQTKKRNNGDDLDDFLLKNAGSAVEDIMRNNRNKWLLKNVVI